MKDKNRVIVLSMLLLSFLGGAAFCAPAKAQDAIPPQSVAQVQQPAHQVTDQGQTGGLVQTLIPHAIPSTQLQTSQTTTAVPSLGASGNTTTDITTDETPTLSASSLPTLWNPLNSKSGNYGKTTPVENQNPQNICWAFAGTDAIELSSMAELKITPPMLLPAYYDYLSAANAFSNGAKNNTAITLGSGPRQLSTDGNTSDYVPDMSIQGYNPVPTSAMAQPSTDKPMSQTTFNNLKKSDLQVTDTYKLGGLAPNALPTSNSAIMSRVNQIKQLVYTYGEAQIGLEAEDSIESSIYFNSSTNASYTPYSAATAGSSLVTSYTMENGTTQEFLNEDHELLIVGYDDNYSASNFNEKPSMNGAFIVKNSWGTSWGDKGYFYLSYADVFVAGSDIYADEVAKTQSGQKVYSATNETPDSSGYIIQLGSTSSPVTFTNTYTSQKRLTGQTEQLDSISAYIDQPGITVKVLYKTGGVSTSTSLSSFKTLGTYTFTDAGYQTIPFSAINLPNDSSYTVGIEITNLSQFSSGLNVPIELHSGSIESYPVLTSGNSWINYNGWENVSSASAGNSPFNLFLTANTKMITTSTKVATTTPEVTVYRLYNTQTQAHLYTADKNEFNTLPKLSSAWKQDKDTFTEPKTGTPVYRIYNSRSGEHLWTSDKYQVNTLITSNTGWQNDTSIAANRHNVNKETIAFYSASSSHKIVYALYNVAAGLGSHFDTADVNEYRTLLKEGWKNDNTPSSKARAAWYALSTNG